jgi:hypothetical protein
MSDKPTKSELLAMLAEAVRNTQPQPPAASTTRLEPIRDGQPKLKPTRRSPERASKAQHAKKPARRKQRR